MKAELNKLGNAPRSYSELLTLSSENVEMADGQTQPIRPSLGERFAKIEKARPAVQQIAIALDKLIKKAQSTPDEKKE